MSAKQTTAVGENPMRRNIELKARLQDLAAATETARRIATDHLGTMRQVDTYFHCSTGRLKLRESDTAPAQLIWYARPDQHQPKASDYLLVDVPDPAMLKQALSMAQGVLVVVDKQREIFLQNNVRIHLDDVAELGSFLEFEAVLGPDINDQKGHSQIASLRAEFSISTQDLVQKSYSDLLLELLDSGSISPEG